MRKVENNEYKILDIIKFIATFLIVGSHTLPIFKNNTLNYYYGQWLFRFGVPLFFISSGFFYNSMNEEKKTIHKETNLYIFDFNNYIYTFIY